MKKATVGLAAGLLVPTATPGGTEGGCHRSLQGMRAGPQLGICLGMRGEWLELPW